MLRKSFLRKILSTFLALTLLVCVLPVGVWQAKAGEGDIVYDFTYVDPFWANPTSGSAADMREIPYDMTDGKWAWHSYRSSTITATATTFQRSVFSVYGGTTSPCLNLNTQGTNSGLNNWVALKIKIPDAGFYNAKFSVLTRGAGCLGANIYLLPGATTNIEAAVTAGTGLIAKNVSGFQRSGTSYVVDVSLGGIAVPEQAGQDEYILVLKNLGQQSDRYYIDLVSLTLSPLSAALASASISLGKNTIDMGEITASTVTGTLEDATTTTVSPSYTVYTSSAPGIAAVDENGSVRGITPGEATINASVTLFGITKTTSTIVTVNNASKYSFVPSTIGHNGTIAGLTSYNSVTNPNWAFYWYNSTEARLASARVLVYISTLKTIRMSGSSVSEFMAFKINIPTAGLFQTKVDYAFHYSDTSHYTGCLSSNVYLLPGDTAGADLYGALTTAAPIGVINYPATSAAVTNQTIGKLYSPGPGDYILVFKAKNIRTSADGTGGAGDYGINISNMSISGIELVPLESVDASLVKDTILTRESTSFVVNGLLVDQTQAEMQYATYTYESSSPDIATVDAKGIVTGVKAGTSTITVNATLFGVTKTDTCQITVERAACKIAGTVLSAADAIDSGDADIDNELNTAWKTVVNLKPTFQSETILATADVDPVTKAFELPDIADGTYVLEIKRAGYLSRYITVTVDNDNVNLQDKSLIAGDLNGDYMINGSDTGLQFEVFGVSYGESGYNAQYDIFGDGMINGSDTGLVFENFGLDVTYYNEEVDFES